MSSDSILVATESARFICDGPMPEVDPVPKRMELIQGVLVGRNLGADNCTSVKSHISGRETTTSAEDGRSHRHHDQTMLWIALALLGVALLLRRNGSDGVQLAWPPIELPQLCDSRVYFGVECPGCGLTRSILALKDGEFRTSWQLHRLGWLIALAVVGQIPYGLYSLSRSDKNVVTRSWAAWFGPLLIAALVVNWLLKVSGL